MTLWASELTSSPVLSKAEQIARIQECYFLEIGLGLVGYSLQNFHRRICNLNPYMMVMKYEDNSNILHGSISPSLFIFIFRYI